MNHAQNSLTILPGGSRHNLKTFITPCFGATSTFQGLSFLRSASVYGLLQKPPALGAISRRNWPLLCWYFQKLLPPSSTEAKPWFWAIFPGGTPAGAGGTPGGSFPLPPLALSSSSSSSSLSASSIGKVMTLFPTNPSLGLFFLSPLVPAADNRPALMLLTAVQALFGLLLMTRKVPKIGESRFRYRATSALRFLAGCVTVFLSGFEILRLMIPYDPWAEEAKVWRHWATKHGHNPSYWYGGIAFYKPMLISEWKVKMSSWITNTINHMEASHEEDLQLEKSKETDAELLTSISIGPRAVLKMGQLNTYRDIYESLFVKNCKRCTELLEGELKDVTELNKAARIDAILENKGHVHLNEEYSKPNLQLGTHNLDSDEEFEMVWANFEPWDELRQETDFDVRLIPRWRCIEDMEQTE